MTVRGGTTDQSVFEAELILSAISPLCYHLPIPTFFATHPGLAMRNAVCFGILLLIGTIAASAEPPKVWWSFQPIVRPSVAPSGNPIDAFILAQLKEKALSPSPEADRRTLIRRLTFDLTGLPPTPEEIRAFVEDKSPDAYEKLLDHLLASPAYGERMARLWMDAVHFAETHGHDQDRVRPNAWRYRDYLIAAFNSDTPYNRFIREQIAADVLYPDQPKLTPALGFLAAGPWDESSLRPLIYARTPSTGKWDDISTATISLLR